MTNKTSNNEIAEIIRYCRKQNGLTQQQLAQIAGIGKTTIFDIEHGKLSVQLDTLLKVCVVLNIKLSLQPPFAWSKEQGA